MANKQPKGVRYGGRAPGTPNKTTAALKEMVLQALNECHPQGSVGYLKAQALANPAAFMSLLGRVLPMQVTGQDGGAIKVESITRPTLTREEWLALHGAK